ncbi:MAG: SCO1664 family protein [Chloroflexi bacterium]|nr:MAG: SCO1664 family protein [Chloroflexota bacterium]
MAESTAELDGARALRILREGTIRPRGLMPDCSNYTYLAQVRGHDGDLLAVYKPASGEMPLDDFPDGTLGKREVAAYLVSEALGWRVVPPTVYRADGPHGPGSLQQFIAADLSQHYFTMMPKRAEDFRMMAAFDCIVNNADRKSGHCLLDDTGHIWGVDNGLTFHPLPKLRTVIWEFGGEAVPQTLRSDAGMLAERLLGDEPWVKRLRQLLAAAELRTLAQRAGRVAKDGTFPHPSSRWAYPWPLV